MAERTLTQRELNRGFENDRIRIDPFRRLDRATRRSLDEEAERLAEFHR